SAWSAERISGRGTARRLRLRRNLLRAARLRHLLRAPLLGHLLRAPLLRDRAGRGGGRRALLGSVVARLHDVALAAVGAALPLLLELLDEGLQRLLLVLRGEQALDRRPGLVQRLLGTGRVLGDLE